MEKFKQQDWEELMHGGEVIEFDKEGRAKIIDKRTGEDISPKGEKESPEKMLEEKESRKKDVRPSLERFGSTVERFKKETRQQEPERRNPIL